MTDPGRVRSNNEDTFLAAPVLSGRYLAAGAIDGVGGYEGGEVAAQIARDTILEYLRIPSGEVLTMMKESVVAANEKILQAKRSNPQWEQMACVLTLALADPQNNQFFYVHVGDTRLYLFRDQSLIKISHDQSFVGFLEDSGRLSEAEAMRHPKRNEINKALGFTAAFTAAGDYMESGQSPFLPGDLLLLCSDGLTDMIDAQAIVSVLRSEQSLEEKGATLIRLANAAGGRDNITAVLLEHPGKPAAQKATRPKAVKKAKKGKPDTLVAEVPATAPSVTGTSAIAPAVPQKKYGSNRWILALIALVLAGGLLWYFFGRSSGENGTENANGSPRSQQGRNPAELHLARQLDSARPELDLSDSVYGDLIYISDTLPVQGDSLVIRGNGITFACDSAYRGALFSVPADCRYVLLEDIILQDFPIGIRAEGPVLHLKNVRFINCTVPVQYGFIFPEGRAVTGRIEAGRLFPVDSLPLKN
jgi:serine/threonine protein phosphatase PrpC